MGTSKSNFGPRNNTPLLPDWANDLPDDEGEEENKDEKEKQQDQEKSIVSWQQARTSLKKYANQPSTPKLKQAVRSYILAGGGGRTAAKSARHGKQVARRLGGFLTGISTEGIARTIEKLGIGNVEGLSAEAVFAKLIEAIGPAGGTDEEAAARIALAEALSKLYSNFELENKDISELNGISKENINEVIRCYVTRYIYERWLLELGRTLEGADKTPTEIARLEEEIYEFIDSSVALEFQERDLTQVDFNQGEGKEMIENIFQNAYSLLEAL